jgi:hypothetical protein
MGLIVGAVVWIQFSHKLPVGRAGARVDRSVADAPATPGATPSVRQTVS